jgi:hypothetical protein
LDRRVRPQVCHVEKKRNTLEARHDETGRLGEQRRHLDNDGVGSAGAA